MRPRGTGGAADLPALVAATYRSALSARPFAELLPDLTKALGGDAALVALWAPEVDAGEMAVSHAMPRRFVDAYRGGLWKSDAWRLALVRKNVPVGQAVAGRALVPFRDLQRTDMYNDVLKVAGYFDTCCGRIYARDAAGAAISLLRGRGHRFFGRSETGLLGGLLPHMTRAFALRRRFASLIAERTALAAIVDARHAGAIFCDRTGRIVHATARARGLLDEGSALFAMRGLLRARDPAADKALAAALDLRAAAPERALTPLSLPVRGSDGSELRLSIVRPVRATVLDAGGSHVVSYVLVDEAETPRDAPAAPAARFGLTPAEARLAACLGDGASLRRAAEQLGVSINTVRSQLQRIFEKTGVSRQAALIRLLLAER